MPVHLTWSVFEVNSKNSELSAVGVDCVIDVQQRSSTDSFKCKLWTDSGLPTHFSLKIKHVFLVDVVAYQEL